MIGADAHALGPAALNGPLPALVRRLTELPVEALPLDAISAAALDLVHERVVAAVPSLSGSSAEPGVRKDHRWIVRYTAAAVAVDDPTVLDEFLGWLSDLDPDSALDPDAR